MLQRLIPADHPIRKIRVVADAALADLDPVFDEMYATSGRRSVPPEFKMNAAIYNLIRIVALDSPTIQRA